MARLTITLDAAFAGLPDAVIPRLQLHADRTNATQKTALTALDWLVLHIKELAITDDLAVAVHQIQEQAQKDAQTNLETTLKTARDELLTSLDPP